MDLKTRILRWERWIEDDPAMLVLIILVVLTVIFIGVVYLDAYLKKRREKRRKRASK